MYSRRVGFLFPKVFECDRLIQVVQRCRSGAHFQEAIGATNFDDAVVSAASAACSAARLRAAREGCVALRTIATATRKAVAALAQMTAAAWSSRPEERH